MIEDLYEFLIRKYYQENIAEDICNHYRRHGLSGVADYAQGWNDDEHDYVDEMVNDVKQWQIESGEVDDPNYWDFIEFDT